MKRIAIVEDEALMRDELETMLKKAGYETEAVCDFETAAECLLELSPDLVLLDLNLPGAGGFQICRSIKQKSSIPVVVLTSRDQMKDELLALDLGADEYLTKPCRRERLLARISNVMKRYEGRTNLLEGDGFLLDRQTYTMYINGQSVILPKNQGKILETFLTQDGRTATKQELCRALWGTEEYIDENALQVNLTRLKKTMAELDMDLRIEPVRGVGHRLVRKGKEESYEA